MTEPTSASSLALDLTLKDAKLEAALATASARAVKENWADRAIGRRDPSVAVVDLVAKSVSGPLTVSSQLGAHGNHLVVGLDDR